MTVTAAAAGKIQPRLKQKYRSEISPALATELGLKNVHQIPGLTKTVVNMGVGEAARDGKIIDGAIADITAITGQKPMITKARKSRWLGIVAIKSPSSLRMTASIAFLRLGRLSVSVPTP
jgi:large subunit ribosomal protein L5